mgnify:CR=1 FL=1
MFQTQLPSGRRRLLFILLILFTIAVFGTRYVLIALGWVGKQTDPTAEQSLKQTQMDHQLQQATFSTEQLQQAKETAETFLQRYTQRDLHRSEAWLNSFVNLLSPEYAEELRMEAERSRPTVLVKKTNFQAIRRSACYPQEEKVSCHMEATIEEVDVQDRATMVDKNYEVILSLQNGKWKVEGLNIYGSFD